jgi:allantoin racemase
VFIRINGVNMIIDVVMVISGLDNQALDRRRRLLDSMVSPGNEARLVFSKNAPLSVESQAEMELAAPGILERIVKSELEGADAVVIWGGHDPSLLAARELVSIPVIGPGMASMYLASMLAEKFSLIIQLPHVLGIAKRQVRNLGLKERCVGIYSVGIPVLELGKRESFESIRKVAITSVEKDGADAVCFGCMALNDHAIRLSTMMKKSHPGVIVIPPGLAAVRLAETIVGIGLSHSKRSYPNPPKKVAFPF